MIDRIYIVRLKLTTQDWIRLTIQKMKDLTDGEFRYEVKGTDGNTVHVRGEFFSLVRARRAEKKWKAIVASVGGQVAADA